MDRTEANCTAEYLFRASPEVVYEWFKVWPKPYEAIPYASAQWSACRPAISHLSGSGQFHQDIAMCKTEALAHFCDANPSAIDSFTVLGCCMSVEHFAGIARLNTEGQTGRRRSIIVEVENKVSHTLVHLSWDSNA